ncbi:MAG: AAA family ATPase [Pseudomonadota bacterium]
MHRFFNTTGPCDPARHYMLPAERRLPDLDHFVERQLYFVLHAARQTGKTTTMRAFAARLRRAGHVALVATLETSQGDKDIAEAEPKWLQAIWRAAIEDLEPEAQPPQPRDVEGAASGERLAEWLRRWCRSVAPRAVMLLLDEADVVSGQPMVNLLRQLRSGFALRPDGYPSSVALVGMRDLRDYLALAKDGVPINPGSPFNIKAASLTLRNFDEDEIAELYAQHTAETGQAFSSEAIARAWWWTEGQPFLVNAIADRITTWMVPDGAVITAAHVDRAKDELILARTTHLDNLAWRLKEPRVAPILASILLGDRSLDLDPSSDDFEYCKDLGLVRAGPEGPQVANPLYREVLARALTQRRQDVLPVPWWPWRTSQGGLDFPALIAAFLEWWRENAEILVETEQEGYREAAAHLAFMGFLQRVVNGGGAVYREYAAARGRVDLLVTWGNERHVVELKRVPPRHRTLEKVRSDGINQLAGYLDTLGLREGWLLVFDQRAGRTWEQRLWEEDLEIGDKILRLRGA